MARKAGVVLVAETAAFQRGMDQAVASAAALDGELKKLGVDAIASAEAQAKATETRIARLQQEAGALGRTAAAQIAAGESAVGALSAQDRKLAQLARLQGEVGLSAQESAKLNVAATMGQVDALDAQIAAYRELGLAAGASGREQQIANRFGTEAAASKAALLGLPAPKVGEGAARLRNVGRGLTTYVTAPAAFVGYEAVKGAIDFNQQMLLLQTQAGASAAQVHKLNGQVLDLARIAPQGPVELSKGLFHLISLGVPAAHSMGVLKTASLAAGMGVADLEDTTTALGAAVVSGIGGARNYNQAMATLVATAGSGNMRFADLASSVGNILAPAKSVGISLRELGASMAVLTDRGMNAHEAATRLRMTFLQMAAPSEPAKKALKDLGINADSLGGMLRKPNGLLTVLQLLHDRVNAVGKVRGNRDLAEAFGRGRGSLGILTLVQSLDSPLSSYGSKLAQIGKLEQQYARNQHDYMESPAYKLHAAWSTIQADLIRLGTSLTPVAVTMADAAAKIAGAFNSLPGFVKKDIGTIVAILGVGGPLLLAGLKVQKMVRAIATTFRLLPLSAGPAIATTDAELATLGGAAGRAESKVAGLRSGLMSLKGIGVITIAIGLNYFIDKYGLKNSLKAAWNPDQTLGPPIANDKTFMLGGKRYISGTGEAYTALVNSGASLPPINKVSAAEEAAAARKLGGADSGHSGHGRPAGGRDRPSGPHYDPLHPTADQRPSKPDTGPKTIKDFVLPYQIQLDQARAQTTKSTADDLAAAREVVAYAKKQIDSGRLSHKAMLAAMQEEASAQQQLWGVQTAANKEAAKKAQNFALPMKLQLAQARADALAASIPNLQGPTGLQLRLARQEKAAAEKALKSHHLTIQAMIDAWGIIGQANSVLAQKAGSKGMIDTYHTVSSRNLTEGMNLTHDQQVTLEERLAQRAAHRGSAPNQGAVGGGSNIHTRSHSAVPDLTTNIVVELRGDIRKLISEIRTDERRTHQRAGARR